jgi:acyl-CoA thioester hydrolase
VPLPDFKHRHRIRVRYGEGDQQGVVFNARYLDYGDIAITEYWRAVGFSFTGSEAMEFHVARAEVDFKKPIYPDELIDLWSRTERFGRTSMATWVEIHGAGEDGGEDLRATIREIHVHVDLDGHRPVPIPDAMRARFEEFDARPDVVLTGEAARR